MRRRSPWAGFIGSHLVNGLYIVEIAPFDGILILIEILLEES